MVHEHAALNASNSQAIFPLVYDVDTGGYQGGSARCVHTSVEIQTPP